METVLEKVGKKIKLDFISVRSHFQVQKSRKFPACLMLSLLVHDHSLNRIASENLKVRRLLFWGLLACFFFCVAAYHLGHLTNNLSSLKNLNESDMLSYGYAATIAVCIYDV